jgi:hypothetical protein
MPRGYHLRVPDRCSPTLAEALADWLTVRSAGRGLSPNTLRAYRADVERVAVQLGPAPTAGDDRPAAARARVDQLTPTAKAPLRGPQGYRPYNGPFRCRVSMTRSTCIVCPSMR